MGWKPFRRTESRGFDLPVTPPDEDDVTIPGANLLEGDGTPCVCTEPLVVGDTRTCPVHGRLEMWSADDERLGRGRHFYAANGITRVLIGEEPKL